MSAILTAVDRYGNESMPCQINGIQTSFNVPEHRQAPRQVSAPQKQVKQIANCPLLERSNTLELKDLCNTFEIFRKEGIRYVFEQDIFRLPDNKLAARAEVHIVSIVNGKLTDCPELFKMLID